MKGFFKRIGKGIKKGFQKFGKFMGKIGILGQIAMMFILPAVGGLMLRGLGAVTGLAAPVGSAAAAAGGLGTASGFTAAAAGASGVGGAIAKGVAWTLKTAQGFANSPLLKPFKTVTDAVNGFMKNTVSYVGSKVGLGNIGKAGGDWANFFDQAPDKFWVEKGTDTVLARVGESVTNNWDSFVGDMQKGNILMGGDTSLQKAWTEGKGFAERQKLIPDAIPELPPEPVPNAYQGPNIQETNQYRVIDASASGTSPSSFSMEKYNMQPTPFEGGVQINTPSGQPLYAPQGTLETMSQVEGINFMDQGFSYASSEGSWVSNLGDGIKDTLWKGEESLLQNLRPRNMLGKVGEGVAEIPGTMVKQSLLAPMMGGGGGGGPYWGSTAGPTSNPGRDRAEQFAYTNMMTSAGASSQYFGSDYDIFTAIQNERNPYGTDMGGTWGNYMSKQLVA